MVCIDRMHAFAADGGRDKIPELTWVRDAGQLWLSSVTMQGTGTDQSLAIDGFSHVHAESVPLLLCPCIHVGCTIWFQWPVASMLRAKSARPPPSAVQGVLECSAQRQAWRSKTFCGGAGMHAYYTRTRRMMSA